jgi:hypothetical protein
MRAMVILHAKAAPAPDNRHGSIVLPASMACLMAWNNRLPLWDERQGQGRWMLQQTGPDQAS